MLQAYTHTSLHMLLLCIQYIHAHTHTHTVRTYKRQEQEAFCFNNIKLQDRLIWKLDNSHAQLHPHMFTLLSCRIAVSEMEKLSAQLQMFTEENGVFICTFSITLLVGCFEAGDQINRLRCTSLQTLRDLFGIGCYTISQSLTIFFVETVTVTPSSKY